MHRVLPCVDYDYEHEHEQEHEQEHDDEYKYENEHGQEVSGMRIDSVPRCHACRVFRQELHRVQTGPDGAGTEQRRGPGS